MPGFSQVTIDGNLETRGTVIAHGPVIVQGVDIKAELDRLRDQVAHLDKKFESRIDDVFYFVLENYEMKNEERSALKNTLETSKKMVDWASRAIFIAESLKVLSPILAVQIMTLIQHADKIILEVSK